ncbi:MAG: efflux RND transporter periplasmic adaptor subunit [Deltaproteobacteria bacterium]|nr:efflux RND transporter periplasmic adaptor subunit [Deltaproteobacteria bacterium]
MRSTVLWLFAPVLAAAGGCSLGQDKANAGALLVSGPGEGTDGAGESAAGPSLAVTVVRWRAAGETVTSANGSLWAAQETMVMAEVPGKIKALYAEEGDLVAGGSPLADLDTTDYELNVQQAETNLRMAQTGLRGQRTNYRRVRQLGQDGVVAEAAVDGSQIGYDVAAAQVALAEVGVAAARRRLGQTTIVAPYDALVVNRLVSPGAVVQVMPPTVFYRLQDVTHLRLKVRVPELSLPNVAVGDRVEARFQSLGLTVDVAVTAVIGSIDPMSRTFDVVSAIDNTAYGMALRPGLFADARIVHASPGARPMLPGSAVLPVEGRPDQVRVFVVDGGVAREKLVRAVAAAAGGWEVREGLAGEFDLVVSDPAALTDGAAVTVTAAPAPPAPPAPEPPAVLPVVPAAESPVAAR